MVAVAQLVERQFVELNVAGSSPVSHPNFFSRENIRILAEVKINFHFLHKIFYRPICVKKYFFLFSGISSQCVLVKAPCNE